MAKVKAFDRETNRVVEIESANIAPYVESGRMVLPDSSGNFAFRDQAGRADLVNVEDVPQAVTRGATIEEPEFTRARKLERQYGGQHVTTAAEGFASGLTLGLYDVAARAFGGEETVEAMRQRAMHSPLARTLGETGGSVAGVALGGAGGAVGRVAGATPAGLAGRAGGAVGRIVEGGLGSRAAGIVARETAIGGLIGAGSGVSKTALSSDPFSVEQAAKTIGHEALVGGGAGAAVGGVGITLSRLASGGRTVAERWATRSARPAASSERGVLETAVGIRRPPPAGSQVDDVSRMGEPELRVAHKAELDRIEAQRVGERESLAADLIAHRKASREGKYWLATDDAEVRAIGRKASVKLSGLSDRPKSLADRPWRAGEALEMEEVALRRILEQGDQLRARATHDATEALWEIRGAEAKEGGVVLKGKAARVYREHFGVRKTFPVATPEQVAELERVLGSGEYIGARVKALEQAKVMLERNIALQERLEAVVATPASGRLDAISARLEDLGRPVSPGGKMAEHFGGYMAGGALMKVGVPFPLAVMAGAKVGKFAGQAVDRGLRRAVEDLGSYVSKGAEAGRGAIAKAAGVLVRTGKASGRAVPVLSTRVLGGTSFGPQQAGRPERDPGGGTDLARLYRRREAELRRLIGPGPD